MLFGLAAVVRIGALGVPLLTTGCLFPFGGPTDRDERFNLDENIYLPHDVKSSVSLRYSGELKGNPREIVRIKPEKGSGLNVVEQSLSATSISLVLRASKLGSHDLKVIYRDRRGRRYKQIFRVHVHAIEHTTLSVACDNRSGSQVYLVHPGAQISYSGQGKDDAGRSYSLRWVDPVVDADGFELLDPDKQIRIAPDEPGSYTWKLYGEETREVEFVVYDPQQLKPSIRPLSRSESEFQQVVIGLNTDDVAGEGQEICLLPQSLRADVETDGEACLPTMGWLHFEDGLSLDIAESDQSFWIHGEGECLVSASLSTGGTHERSLEVESPAVPEPKVEGELVPVEGIDIVAPPNDSLASEVKGFECTQYQVFQDPDVCSRGFVMVEGDRDGCVDKIGWVEQWLTPLPDPQFGAIGRGLSVQLVTGLVVTDADREFAGLRMSPTKLQFLGDDSDTPGLVWKELGCNEEKGVWQMTALTSGAYNVQLSAANSITDRPLDVEVRDIGRTSLAEVVAPTSDPSSPAVPTLVHPEATTRHVFAGFEGRFGLVYYDDEDHELDGIGIVRATATNAAGQAFVREVGDEQQFWFNVGHEQNEIEVASPHAPDTHLFLVHDDSGIADLDGVDVVQLDRGQASCFQLTPLAEDGTVIRGQWPALPMVQGARAKLVASMGESGNEVCLTGYEKGDVDLRWSWGKARRLTPWNVN